MNFCETHGVIKCEIFLVLCVFEVIHFAVADVKDWTDALCLHFVKNLHLSLVWTTQLIDCTPYIAYMVLFLLACIVC